MLSQRTQPDPDNINQHQERLIAGADDEALQPGLSVSPHHGERLDVEIEALQPDPRLLVNQHQERLNAAEEALQPDHGLVEQFLHPHEGRLDDEV